METGTWKPVHAFIYERKEGESYFGGWRDTIKHELLQVWSWWWVGGELGFRRWDIWMSFCFWWFDCSLDEVVAVSVWLVQSIEEREGPFCCCWYLLPIVCLQLSVSACLHLIRPDYLFSFHGHWDTKAFTKSFQDSHVLKKLRKGGSYPYFVKLVANGLRKDAMVEDAWDAGRSQNDAKPV